MLALLFSVLASTCIFVVFRLFTRFGVDRLQAIVVNYLTAACCGLLFSPQAKSFGEVLESSWLIYALMLGALFILVFNLMALTTQRNGLAAVSVATKMSFIIPVLFGIFYYHESTNFLKLLGILLAVAAVYFTSIKKGSKAVSNSLLLPALVLLGSGIIDTSIKYLEGRYVAEDEVAVFSGTIFFAAAMVGIIILGILAIQGKLKIKGVNLVAGIALGIPNFFSVYFLVMALRSQLLDSSGIFVINNVAIVTTSTLLGILLFRERLDARNWLGIAMALASIVLVALTQI